MDLASAIFKAWFAPALMYLAAIVLFYAACCYNAGKYPERNRG